MISLTRPSPEIIRNFLARQADCGFTYPEVGCTAKTPPPRGYRVDHTRVKLGDGPEVFDKARDALRRWDQFRLGWVGASPEETTIEVGEVVAIVAREVQLWWLNACRVIYVDDLPARFGFAYGTLPEHAGKGEERFLVEHDPETGEVWYDILAFSKPNMALTRLAYPYMRRVQKRFGRQSAAAMLKAVSDVRV